MIRQNLRFIINNSKYLMGLFLICFFTCMIMIYQEKKDGFSGIYRWNCLNWALEQEEPRKALEQAYEEVFASLIGRPIQNGQYAVRFTDSWYSDCLLLKDIQAYFQDCEEYEAILTEIQKRQQAAVNYSGSSDEMKMRNLVSYRQYATLYGSHVAAGNYLAWEKFFSFGMADIGVCLIIFMTVYFLVVTEREKGMSHLMFAAKNGGQSYFFVKAAAAILVSTVALLFMLGMKFLLLKYMYGFRNSDSAMQSMNGYLSAPYRLSIRTYSIFYILWKVAGTWLLTLGALVLCSMALSEAGCGLVVAAITGLSLLILHRIAGYSSWVALRDANIFQLWNVGYWFTGLRYYAFGTVGNWLLQIYGMAFPISCFCLYLTILLLSGMWLYHQGLHKSGAKHLHIGRLWKYRGPLWRNEFLFVSVYRHCLALGIILVVLPGIVIFSFRQNYHEKVEYERQLVTLLNEKSFSEACEWLDDKEAELNRLEASLLELAVQVGTGEISESAYQQMYASIRQQLGIRPLVEQFLQQAEEMRLCLQEQGIVCKFEYTALSDEINGENGESSRLMISVFISIFLIFGVLTIFPADRQLGMHRLVGATPDGIKSMTLRSIWLIIMTFFLAVVLHFLWIYSLYVQYQLLNWDVPVQSWHIYRQCPFPITLKSGIILNVLWQGIKWAVFAALGLGVSLMFTNAVWIQLAGIVFFLCPLAFGVAGVKWIKYIPYWKYISYSGQDILVHGWDTVILILICCGAILLIRKEQKRWIQL